MEPLAAERERESCERRSCIGLQHGVVGSVSGCDDYMEPSLRSPMLITYPLSWRFPLADTIRTIENYTDCIVLRHFQEGSAKRAAKVSSVPILNAGDGPGQHPSQVGHNQRQISPRSWTCMQIDQIPFALAYATSSISSGFPSNLLLANHMGRRGGPEQQRSAVYPSLMLEMDLVNMLHRWATIRERSAFNMITQEQTRQPSLCFELSIKQHGY